MNKKLALLTAVIFMLTTLLLGCGADKEKQENGTSNIQASNGSGNVQDSTAQKLEKVELNVLVPGDVPRLWEEVLTEINKRTEEAFSATLNVTYIPWSDYADKTRVKLVSGETFDALYDAPWMHMGQMISQNAIMALDELIEKNAPNITKNFSSVLLNANKMNGKLYGLPLHPYLYREPGGVLIYRSDLADKYGVSNPKTLEDFEKYLKAVVGNEKGLIGLCHDPLVMVQKTMVQPLNERVLLLDGVGSRILNAYYNIDTKKVEIRSVFENPAFVSTEKTLYNWYKEGLIDKEMLTRKDDVMELFKNGKVAMVMSDKYNLSSYQEAISKSVPGAKISGQSLYPDDYKFMQDFAAWNFLCINAKAENPERMMMFLDWSYASEDNYDLIRYGIKDKHWVDSGNNEWDYGTGLDITTGYNSSPYLAELMQFDKDWVKDDAAMKEEWKKLRDFNGFLVSPLLGFSFNSEPVKNEIAQLEAIAPQTITLLNSAVVDIDQVRSEYEKKWKDAGLDVVRMEFQKQLDDFLAANPIK